MVAFLGDRSNPNAFSQQTFHHIDHDLYPNLTIFKVLLNDHEILLLHVEHFWQTRDRCSFVQNNHLGWKLLANVYGAVQR